MRRARFGVILMLTSPVAIGDRIGLLRIAEMPLVQAAAVTGGIRVAVVATLEAIVDWRVAFVTHDKTSVEFILS